MNHSKRRKLKSVSFRSFGYRKVWCSRCKATVRNILAYKHIKAQLYTNVRSL